MVCQDARSTRRRQCARHTALGADVQRAHPAARAQQTTLRATCVPERRDPGGFRRPGWQHATTTAIDNGMWAKRS